MKISALFLDLIESFKRSLVYSKGFINEVNKSHAFWDSLHSMNTATPRNTWTIKALKWTYTKTYWVDCRKLNINLGSGDKFTQNNEETESSWIKGRFHWIKLLFSRDFLVPKNMIGLQQTNLGISSLAKILCWSEGCYIRICQAGLWSSSPNSSIHSPQSHFIYTKVSSTI